MTRPGVRRITAAVATGPDRPFEIQSDVLLEGPRADEVLVEIHGVGICHTDLAARDGFYGLPYPVVLGHEGAGIVLEVGSEVRHVRPGDKVVLSFASCGSCSQCAAGLPGYCDDFASLNYGGARTDASSSLTLGGKPLAGHFFGQSSFATHVVAHERSVVLVNTELPAELLGPLGCSIQTGAGAILKSLALRAGQSVIVIGAGPVGLAAIMAARLCDALQIIAVDPIDARRVLAEKSGATMVLDPTASDYAESLQASAPLGVDAVLDTSGNVSAIEAALGCIGPRTTIGLVGVPRHREASISVNVLQLMHFGASVRGIVEGDADPQVFIPELLAYHAQGRFPFDSIIRTRPLDQIAETLEAQGAGEPGKFVLTTSAASASSASTPEHEGASLGQST